MSERNSGQKLRQRKAKPLCLCVATSNASASSHGMPQNQIRATSRHCQCNSMCLRTPDASTGKKMRKGVPC
jgi:hypothetical protein